ncbi:MAG: apolipoprotein N-acyltransferase [Planctomycetes bacterium]|nr:apolipoprotein N-acyltransferase [Planctomycetota bacterium]
MERKRVNAEALPSSSASAPLAAAGLVLSTHKACLLLALATVALKSVIFAPLSWWPLGFICLVPWLVMVGCAHQAPRVYAYSYLLGLAFFLLNMRWMYHATGWGYLALSIYQAVYFPLAACPLRSVVRRRHWPLAIAFPLVWVGSEMLRAVVISGFPWFFLSHSLYSVLSLIQISDVTGAYGASFVVAAINGAVADLVIAREATRSTSLTPFAVRGTRLGVGVALTLLLATILYGQFQLHRDTGADGPRVAVVQGDYLNSVNGDEVKDVDKRRTYFAMMDAAAKEEPDLFLLPESPWIMYLNPESRGFFPEHHDSFATLQGYARRFGAYVVTGSASYERTPTDLLAPERKYNSATVFYPDGREPGRYDKVHLVYFGETVPFRFGRFRFLYFWLNAVMPFSGPDHDYEYSLFPGDGFHSFSMTPRSVPDRSFRFGIPICYEDVMPYVSRAFASGGEPEKRVDFLLNISNDGWFGRGVQQPQHLAICVFRAVENRVGIARAVNTGLSGFIDPTGRVHGVVTGEPPSPWGGLAGYSVARVKTDSRYTVYSRYGDWFGWSCAAMWLALFVDYWIVRARGLMEA